MRMLDDILQDVRYTLRQLHRAPLFAVTAVLSLAMGIGVNTAVFTVIERVLLRALPVSNPQEIVFLADQRVVQRSSPRFSYPFFVSLQGNRVLQGVAARYSLPLNVESNGQTARVSGELISGNYFALLGARTQLGRPLAAEDDQTPGAHSVAVISDKFWRRAFESDLAVVGRELRINSHTFQVVGVAASDFAGTDISAPAEIWVPLAMQRQLGRDLRADSRTNWLEIIGRVDRTANLERAGAELTTFFHSRAPELRAQFGDRQLVLLPSDNGYSPSRKAIGPALRILMALSALALVIACVNVAGLLAVRSAARQKEIAIRLVLGARQSRLTQQFLTEALVLTSMAGAAALLVVPWAARLIVASQPYAALMDAAVDVRVLIFGLAASVVTGLVVGQATMVASRKTGAMHSGEGLSRNLSAAFRRLSAHDFIVTFQIAMSLAMLITAALLVQSLRSLNSVDPGFRAADLLLVSLDPRAAGYDGKRVEGFWRDTLERVSQLPGVRNVSLARLVPMAPGGQRQPWVNAATGEQLMLDTNFVGPHYFRTLDIPLLRGREFDERDGKTSRPVVIVNERLAAMFWPDQDPIGKGIRLPDSVNQFAEVIGLVRDVKYRDLRSDTGPMFYRPVLQTSSTDAMTLHVRVASDQGGLVGAIRGAIERIDANVPAFGITTLEEQLNASFGQTRQAAVLTGLFGVLAVLLSAVGVYGVTALAVKRRTRDIGIRMALGAQRHDILRLVGQRAASLVITGVAVGLVTSLAITQVASTLLYGVRAGDAVTFAGMAALLAAISLVAFSVPLRTAVRLDAATAIRHE